MREIKFEIWDSVVKQMLSCKDIDVLLTLEGKVYALDISRQAKLIFQ